MNPGHLPVPDQDSLAHSERLAARIRAAIEQAGGSIGFAEFMQHALYADGLGYYSAGATKFGEAGDFVTAPEVSPLFAKILANQVAAVLDQFDDAAERQVLEFGAGTGVLAIGLIQHLDALDSLPTRYYILDVSADLQQRQYNAIQTAIPHHLDKFEWISKLPKNYSGVVIANEVLDAMPVERFSKKGNHVLRQSVACDGGEFRWLAEPASELLENAVKKIETNLGAVLPDGFLSEVSLGLSAWIADLAECLDRGFIFLFDYGVTEKEYYAPDRHDGWLRCHFRHRAHSDPLIYPGLQDLSAWVNFSQVANAAFDAGLQIAGYVTQSRFLLDGGLPQALEGVAELSTEAQIEASRQVKVLTMPAEMGENFKCLGLSKGTISVPEPLMIADRAHTL